jgi:hypothetical protein
MTLTYAGDTFQVGSDFHAKQKLYETYGVKSCNDATGPWILKSTIRTFEAQQNRTSRKTDGYTSSDNNSSELKP